MRKWLRYGRVAFSAVCLLLGLLLVAVWIRSYWVADTALLQTTARRAVQVDSFRGVASLESLYFNDDADPLEFHLESEEITDDFEPPYDTVWGFGWEVARGADGGSHTLSLPYWLIVLLLAAIAIVPWIRFRFRLRTLLIVMAVVAAALGAVAYALR